MTTKDPEARLFRERVKWGELMHVKQMLKDGVNFQEAGSLLTQRRACCTRNKDADAAPFFA